LIFEEPVLTIQRGGKTIVNMGEFLFGVMSSIDMMLKGPRDIINSEYKNCTTIHFLKLCATQIGKEVIRVKMYP
jgi:hypothetical protein